MQQFIRRRYPAALGEFSHVDVAHACLSFSSILQTPLVSCVLPRVSQRILTQMSLLPHGEKRRVEDQARGHIAFVGGQRLFLLFSFPTASANVSFPPASLLPSFSPPTTYRSSSGLFPPSTKGNGWQG